MQPAKKEITIEELRRINGYEDMSDEELLKVAEGIKELALLLNLIPLEDQHSKK